MQSTYGHSSCYLLRVNSLKEPKSQSSDDMWDYLNTSYNLDDSEENHNSGEFENSLNYNDDSLLHPLSPQEYSKSIDAKSVGPKIYGAYLNSDDYINIKELTKHFITRSLIPYIESQIQSLNESVSNLFYVNKNCYNCFQFFIIKSLFNFYRLPIKKVLVDRFLVQQKDGLALINPLQLLCQLL